jgi:hypothetical protein
MTRRSYLTHHNRERLFLVTIDSTKKTASIYKKTKRAVINAQNDHKLYSKLIKTYKYEQVFIGRDGLQKPTYPGNSILLRIGNLRYVYVGEMVYEFSTDERITKYHSPVGNNDVPYPTADAPTKTYFMLDRKYVPNDKIKQIVKKDAYQYYYGHKGYEPLEKYAKRMKKTKVIEPFRIAFT